MSWKRRIIIGSAVMAVTVVVGVLIWDDSRHWSAGEVESQVPKWVAAGDSNQLFGHACHTVSSERRNAAKLIERAKKLGISGEPASTSFKSIGDPVDTEYYLHARWKVHGHIVTLSVDAIQKMGPDYSPRGGPTYCVDLYASHIST